MSKRARYRGFSFEAAKLPSHGERNILPIINMTFLLLLFFVVVGDFSRSFNRDIRPPQSLSEMRGTEMEELELSADGQLWWRGQVIDLPGWINALQAEGLGVPGAIRLRADGAITAAQLIPLLDQFKAAEIRRIALVTQRDGQVY